MATTAVSKTRVSKWRWILRVGVVILLASATPGVWWASSPAASAPEVQFGCPGVTVIANVDCELGVPTAFDTPPADGPAVADTTDMKGAAPWCGAEPDTTRYGCAPG